MVYADTSLIHNFSDSLIPLPHQTKVANLAGNGISHGYNMSLSYDFDENNRFVFSYLSEVKLYDYSNGSPAHISDLVGYA